MSLSPRTLKQQAIPRLKYQGDILVLFLGESIEITSGQSVLIAFLPSHLSFQVGTNTNFTFFYCDIDDDDPRYYQLLYLKILFYFGQGLESASIH